MLKSIWKLCENGELDELKKRRNEIDQLIEDIPNDGDDLREDEDDLSFADEHEKEDFIGDLEDELALTDHPNPSVFIEYALFELNKV